MKRLSKLFLAIFAVSAAVFAFPGHGLAAACDQHDTWQQTQQECTLQDGKLLIVYLNDNSGKYEVWEVDGPQLYEGSLVNVQDWLNLHGATAGFTSNTTNSKSNSASSGCSKSKFFFLPPWWEYIDPQKIKANCTIDVQVPNDILPIGLAIVDMLLRVAGLIAIISIIIAGVAYITAGGAVEKTASARKRIYNALIGLAIVAVASGAVAFIGNKLA